MSRIFQPLNQKQFAIVLHDFKTDLPADIFKYLKENEVIKCGKVVVFF